MINADGATGWSWSFDKLLAKHYWADKHKYRNIHRGVCFIYIIWHYFLIEEPNKINKKNKKGLTICYYAGE